MGILAILEKMTFFTQKILFFKIESCLSLVDRFRIELFDTIFKIRKKIKNESCLVTPYNIMPWVYISEKTQSNVILKETEVGL